MTDHINKLFSRENLSNLPKFRSKSSSNSDNSPPKLRSYSTRQSTEFKTIAEFDQKYIETDRILGIGREGRKPVVEIFRRSDSSSFALKKLQRSTQVIKSTLLQQNLAEECAHIVKIHEIYQSDLELYLVMEKGISHLDPTVENENMNIKDQKLRRTYCIQMVKDVFTGIKFIHDKGYVHGDITLRNILVFPEENQLMFKITDFENYITHSCCTPEGIFHSTSVYRSAEIILDKKVTRKSDYWCLAVCVYIFYTRGRVPFENNQDFLKLIKKCDYNKEPVEIQDPNDPARRLMDKLFSMERKKVHELLKKFT